MSSPFTVPTIDDVRAAARRLAGHARHTPVLTSASLDAMAGAELHFKCENFQRAGAFKFRGATNAVLSLPDSVAAKGVVTHSSGNHAAALALAARLRGIPAYVVMPNNAPGVKQQAVRAYGAQVTLCEPTLEGRHAAAERLLAETGATLVHPYDDPAVIAGQGTVALELHEQVPGLDAVVVPVSGGGLISGIAIASAAVSPVTAVFAAEPAQADDAARSLRSGRLEPLGQAKTIADGLRASLSERTFAVMQQHVRDVVTVSEAEIVRAMRLIWERLKVIAEPSAAVSLAAVFAGGDRFRGRRVGVVLSGGNLDLVRLPWQ
ncbi:MAG TPA: pyridoxal-phosphate dependent enzyme [Gemmataceae bacterium]|jgi:threonine dehydratase|nr:pyridoxal-phosphate dependent enzyme [Gemmataceae bacterium]